METRRSNVEVKVAQQWRRSPFSDHKDEWESELSVTKLSITHVEGDRKKAHQEKMIGRIEACGSVKK